MPDPSHAEGPLPPADVVIMVVCRDNILESGDPFGIEIGRYDGCCPLLARIDQHRAAVRRLDEDRHTLADVEEGEGQGIRDVGRRWGQEDREGQDRKQGSHSIIIELLIVGVDERIFDAGAEGIIVNADEQPIPRKTSYKEFSRDWN